MKSVRCLCIQSLAHGSEAVSPAAFALNGEPADPTAEIVILRHGYPELLIRINEMDRSTSQRLEHLSKAHTKTHLGPR